MDAAIITLLEIPATLSWYHKLYQPPFLPPSTESNAVGCKAWHDIHAGRNSIPAHRDDTEAIVSEQPNGALLPQDPPRHIHRANLAPVLFSDNFRNDFPDTNLLEYIGTAKTIQPRLKMLYLRVLRKYRCIAAGPGSCPDEQDDGADEEHDGAAPAATDQGREQGGGHTHGRVHPLQILKPTSPTFHRIATVAGFCGR